MCLLFAAGCMVGVALYGVARGELPFAAAAPPPAMTALKAERRQDAPPPFSMIAATTDPAVAHAPADPVATGSALAVLPLRLAMPVEPEEAPPAQAPIAVSPAVAPTPPMPTAIVPEPPSQSVAAPSVSAPPAAAMPEPAQEPPAAVPVPDVAVAPPVEPPAPPEPLELRSPQELCADLAAIGMHGAEWKRDSDVGEWSCTPEVERFGRDGASLFATILGIDAETVGMVRFKLNLISETVNETIKERTVTLVDSLSRGLGLALPPEAGKALLAAADYQFSDKNWEFIIRPQENDAARVNIFLRRIPKQQIGMRGGL